MEFSLDQEETGTPHDLLMQLNASALEDNGLLDKFYDAVIAGYDTAENYLIVTIHADYDVPGKAKDNSEMFDASEEVYSYILSAVCPVSLAKPALAFDAEANTFRDRIRDRIVAAPVFGFLFPAFNRLMSSRRIILIPYLAALFLSPPELKKKPLQNLFRRRSVTGVTLRQLKIFMTSCMN